MGRALLFDYLLVAAVAVLAVALTTSLLRRKKDPAVQRWVAIASGIGLGVILALFGADLISALTGANEAEYPEQPLALLMIGMVITAFLAVAAFDGFWTRVTQATKRFLPRAGRVMPVLSAVVAVGFVGALWGLEPDSAASPSDSAPPAADEGGETQTDVPGRPASIALVAMPSGSDDATGPPLTLTAVTEPGALQLPTFLAAPPGDDRLFVLERLGRVRVVDPDGLRSEPLVDIAEMVGPGVDGGLIGLAFHPEFAENGRMFIQYTDQQDDNLVVEYRVDPATATLADPTPIEILHVEKPSSLHAGGMLQFGPDGYLYVAIGDGREFGVNDYRTERDPDSVAQNPDLIPGGILRLDVDAASPYAIPPENAFAGHPANETFAYGLRNPWRFWIDEPSNLMFIGDPGAVTWEEIDVIDIDTAGTNFGWDTTEGTRCYLLRSEFVAACDRTGLTDPILAYRNFKARHPEVEIDKYTGTACAVIFGAVYRGTAIRDLEGTVLYADHCSNWIGGFEYNDGQLSNSVTWEPAAEEVLGTPISFGVDADGEMYLLTAAGGVIYRIDSS